MSSFKPYFNSWQIIPPKSGRENAQAEAWRLANKKMIPVDGDLLLAYDKEGICWYAQYRDSRQRQVGWLGQGRTAVDAVKNVELLNYPNPAENDADLLNGNPS